MNRLLFRSIREYKKQSILTPLFVILEVLMEVLIPYQMANIIDIGIQGSDLGYVIRTGIILVVMAMLAYFLECLRGNLQRKQERAMRKTCGMIFFIRYRIFLLRISTISPRPAL